MIPVYIGQIELKSAEKSKVLTFLSRLFCVDTISIDYFYIEKFPGFIYSVNLKNDGRVDSIAIQRNPVACLAEYYKDRMVECNLIENFKYYFISKLPFKKNEIKICQLHELHRFLGSIKSMVLSYNKDICKFNIVGVSKPVNKLRKNISKVLHQDINILVLGESGTGKELIAKSIYEYSKYRQGRLVSINCGTLQESLFESELFGYSKGAFTGANSNKEGLIEASRNGLMFFDEIAELSVTNQAKLLRVLQEKKYIPLGCTEEKSIDTGFIFATNEMMDKAVDSNVFRKDLYYRVCEYEIESPSLIERKDDILLLIEYHILKNKTNPFSFVLHKSAINALLNYHYPGNIRELISICKVALINSEENLYIKKFDLPKKVFDNTFILENRIGNSSLKYLIKEYERKLIKQALEIYNDDKELTALNLNISKRALFYKIKEYKLYEVK